jgi:hypothetical protein
MYDQRYFMKFLNYTWNLTYGWCILYHAATKSSSSLELAWLESVCTKKQLVSVHKITKQNRNPSEHAVTGIRYYNSMIANSLAFYMQASSHQRR